MPANIPSPIVGAGGQRRQNPIEALLLGLAGQAGSMLLQRALTPAAKPTVAERQRSAAETIASQELAQVPGTQEQSVLQGAVASGVGNANVPTKDVVGLGAIPSARATAPERLALLQQKQETESKMRIRQRLIANLPENLKQSVSMLLDAKDAGAADSSINQLLPYLLPQTEAQTVQLAKNRAETDEIMLRLRQAKTDVKFRKEMADRIGLSSEFVTDGMITEWMQQQDKNNPSPHNMAMNLLETLISRSVVDPYTGQANPAFSVEDAATRAEAGMQLMVPGYKFNITDEQRTIALAGGVLRAAAAREKLNNPGIKPADLTAALTAKAQADFPGIDPARLQELITEAIKSNLLTGL